ncbi:oligopeptide:H+ symporter [Neisseriaceae bacterium B1]
MWNGKVLSMMFVQLIFGLSFYGALTILTPFFLDKLKYSEADTMMIVGAFSALGTLFAVAGGFLGDKLIGEYRALLLSFISFTLGFGAIGFGAAQLSAPWCLLGIALVIFARGLKATNYSTLFRVIFERHEDFEHSFTINYSVNNVGSLVATYGFPFLVGVVAYTGGFGLAAFLCALAVASLIIYRKGILNHASALDRNPISAKSWGIFVACSVAMIGLVFFMFSNVGLSKYIVYFISFLAVAYFLYLTFSGSIAERWRMLCVVVMLLLTIGFYIYYGQMMTSMNVLAINTMRGDLFGFIPLKPESNGVMNPLWCIVAGPVITFILTSLEKRNIHIFIANKVAIAFVFTAIAFGILTWGVRSIGSDLVLTPELFLVVNLFQAFAEVIMGSLVVSFILAVAPARHASFSVSMNMVAMSLSGVIGAIFSTNVALEKGQQLTQQFVTETYGGFFGILTVMAVVMVALAFGSSFAVKKMMAKAESLEKAA